MGTVDLCRMQDRWRSRDGGPPGWLFERSGVLEYVPGAEDLVRVGRVGDFQLHLERELPRPGRGQQERAESGVFLQGRYELRLWGLGDGAPSVRTIGAIYELSAPLRPAHRPGQGWQTLDVAF